MSIYSFSPRIEEGYYTHRTRINNQVFLAYNLHKTQVISSGYLVVPCLGKLIQNMEPHFITISDKRLDIMKQIYVDWEVGV